MRVANRILALLLGVALLAACVVLIVEVVSYLLGFTGAVFDWTASYRWARRTTWDSTAVRVTGTLLVVVGLVLCAAQVVPRRPARLPVRSGVDATDAAITRRGLAQALADAVTDVDGVEAARVKVRRRRVRVKARVRPSLATTSVRDTATSAALERLETLELRRPPRLRVTVATEAR